jgi:RNA polymerase sigma-70 factor (ECF subfamily)
VSQETLLRVLKNLHRYDPKHRFTTWSFTIARNACIDLQRKRKRIGPATDREVVDTAPSPLAQTEQRIRAERLAQALQVLPDMYREILVLYHFEHLKYAEIADVLGIPLGTVMNRIFRARRKLRVIYEDQEAS